MFTKSLSTTVFDCFYTFLPPHAPLSSGSHHYCYLCPWVFVFDFCLFVAFSLIFHIWVKLYSSWLLSSELFLLAWYLKVKWEKKYFMLWKHRKILSCQFRGWLFRGSRYIYVRKQETDEPGCSCNPHIFALLICVSRVNNSRDCRNIWLDGFTWQYSYM